VTQWLDVGAAAPQRPGELRAVPDAATPLAVADVAGHWYAFEDACPHHACPLADGYLDGTTIECDCHGSVFDLTTGAVLRGPATAAIAVYPTAQRDGHLYVSSRPSSSPL